MGVADAGLLEHRASHKFSHVDYRVALHRMVGEPGEDLGRKSQAAEIAVLVITPNGRDGRLFRGSITHIGILPCQLGPAGRGQRRKPIRLGGNVKKPAVAARDHEKGAAAQSLRRPIHNHAPPARYQQSGARGHGCIRRRQNILAFARTFPLRIARAVRQLLGRRLTALTQAGRIARHHRPPGCPPHQPRAGRFAGAGLAEFTPP